MDAAEEAYFNTSDDEDKDEENAPPSRPVKILNGSPLLKPLVDYGDEDDEIDLAANLRPMKARSPTKQLEELSTLETTSPIPTITTSPKVTTPPAGKREQEQSPVPPPKRRKERDDDEDDEDELGRLSRSNSGKRKTPGGAGNKGGLVRKRSFGLFGNSGVGQGPGKKIAISLAPKLTNSPPTQEKSMIVTTTTTITSSDEAEKEN
jgi:protein phosphatase-4 regulatory subunit 3